LKFFNKDAIVLKQVKEVLKKEGSVKVHKLVKLKIKTEENFKLNWR
jgi:hypothetical protein